MILPLQIYSLFMRWQFSGLKYCRNFVGDKGEAPLTPDFSIQGGYKV